MNWHNFATWQNWCCQNKLRTSFTVCNLKYKFWAGTLTLDSGQATGRILKVGAVWGIVAVFFPDRSLLLALLSLLHCGADGHWGVLAIQAVRAVPLPGIGLEMKWIFDIDICSESKAPLCTLYLLCGVREGRESLAAVAEGPHEAEPRRGSSRAGPWPPGDKAPCVLRGGGAAPPAAALRPVRDPSCPHGPARPGLPGAVRRSLRGWGRLCCGGVRAGLSGPGRWACPALPVQPGACAVPSLSPRECRGK